MSRERKKIRILTVIALFALIISAAFYVINVLANSWSMISVVDGIYETAVVIVAFVYIIHSFSKNYANNLKSYFILVAAGYIIEYFFFSYSSMDPNDFHEAMLAITADFVCFGAYVILAFVSDLGRKKSLFVVCVPLVIYTACAVYFAFTHFSADDWLLRVFLECAGYISSSVLDIILVAGKFTDKALRKGKDADK